MKPNQSQQTPQNLPATSLTPRTRFLHEVNELTRQTNPPPATILRSATSGTFRDFGKNDDEKIRFLFLYLRVEPKATFVD